MREGKRVPKVVHMSSVHNALDVRIFHKECRSLVRTGLDVVLIAQHDKDEVIDGVTIRSVSAPSGRKERMIGTTREIYRLALQEKADLYHFHDPELIPVGLILKLLGKRVVYDVHENAPMDVFYAMPYLPPLIRRPISVSLRGMEILAGLMLDGIVTISDAFAKRFPIHKTCVAQNYPIVGERSNALGSAYKLRKSIVAFTGGFARIRCAQSIVEAFSLVNTHIPAELVVVGHMEDDSLSNTLHDSPGWQYTTNMGIVSQQKVYDLVAQSKIGLCLHEMREDYVDISTNKLFDYMLGAIPVIVSPIHSWRKTLEEYECGIVLENNSPAAIAEAVCTLLQDPVAAEEMGRRGRQAVLSCMTWEAEAAKLIEFYQHILGWAYINDVWQSRRQKQCVE